MTEEELTKFVRECQSAWRALEKNEFAKDLALGYAYAVFLAWERSAPGGAWSYTRPHDPSGWIDWATKQILVWESRLSDIGQLQAVNLLVYMSARSNVEVPKWTERLFDLEQKATQRDDFHLLDTVGFALLDPASLRGRVAEELDASRLKRSLEYLRRAQMLFPDDVDVVQHLELALSEQQ